MARPKFIQAKKSYLKSPISSTETGSFVLNQLLDCYGNQLQTSDFSGPMRFTFNPGGADEEIVTATSFTVNSDGTVTCDTGITRALQAKYPYTAGGTAYSHAAGTPVVVLPDNPQLWEEVLAYIDGLALAVAVGASDSVYGYVRTTENLSVIPRVMSALVSQKSSQPSMKLTVNPFALSSLDKDIAVTVATDTAAMVAPVSNPRVDLVVYDTVNAIVTTRVGTENASLTTSNYMTYKPTPTTGDIVLAAVFHRVSETKVLERDDAANGFILRWYTPEVYGTGSLVPSGVMASYAGRAAPSGWVLCDGTTYSRTSATYSPLFAAICPSQTFTVTIASPGVFTTSLAHGLVVGDKLHFTTTGGLPSGLSTNVDYYVLTTPLTTTFTVGLSPSGTVVNTSGSQSGTHTVYKSAWGKGDGLTTFPVPDLRGKSIVAMGQGATAISFEAGAVSAGADTVNVPDGEFPYQGQAVTLTTTGTLPAGLATATTYYIYRSSPTVIKFATSQVNASSNIVVDITGTGSAGAVHTINFTNVNRTILGRMGGEETHGLALSEAPSHTHTIQIYSGGTVVAGQIGTANSTSGSSVGGTGSSGSDAVHNIMTPHVLANYIIKL